ECEGKRFQPHVLKVCVQNKSIHDVLELTVSETIEFFAQIGETTIELSLGAARPRLSGRERNEVRVGRATQISDGLRVLEEVGLGYLRLGQPLNTLSGGESQRLKLVGHLAETENVQRSTSNSDKSRAGAQRPNGKAISNQQSATGNLFIFDEPTTGLHFDDVALLLQLFQRLVDRGHSLVVIEHNLEVI